MSTLAVLIITAAFSLPIILGAKETVCIKKNGSGDFSIQYIFRGGPGTKCEKGEVNETVPEELKST